MKWMRYVIECEQWYSFQIRASRVPVWIPDLRGPHDLECLHQKFVKTLLGLALARIAVQMRLTRCSSDLMPVGLFWGPIAGWLQEGSRFLLLHYVLCVGVWDCMRLCHLNDADPLTLGDSSRQTQDGFCSGLIMVLLELELCMWACVSSLAHPCVLTIVSPLFYST